MNKGQKANALKYIINLGQSKIFELGDHDNSNTMVLCISITLGNEREGRTHKSQVGDVKLKQEKMQSAALNDVL